MVNAAAGFTSLDFKVFEHLAWDDHLPALSYAGRCASYFVFFLGIGPEGLGGAESPKVSLTVSCLRSFTLT